MQWYKKSIVLAVQHTNSSLYHFIFNLLTPGILPTALLSAWLIPTQTLSCISGRDHYFLTAHLFCTIMTPTKNLLLHLLHFMVIMDRCYCFWKITLEKDVLVFLHSQLQYTSQCLTLSWRYERLIYWMKFNFANTELHKKFLGFGRVRPPLLLNFWVILVHIGEAMHHLISWSLENN